MQIFNYNISGIIKDIIFRKLKIRDVKSTLNIISLLSDIDNKRINFKTLIKVNPTDIRRAVKVHNTYIVKGEKYNLEYVLSKIDESLRIINSVKSKYPNLSESLENIISKRISR
jgi:DNA polymerase III delta prime subunit